MFALAGDAVLFAVATGTLPDAREEERLPVVAPAAGFPFTVAPR